MKIEKHITKNIFSAFLKLLFMDILYAILNSPESIFTLSPSPSPLKGEGSESLSPGGEGKGRVFKSVFTYELLSK